MNRLTGGSTGPATSVPKHFGPLARGNVLRQGKGPFEPKVVVEAPTPADRC